MPNKSRASVPSQMTVLNATPRDLSIRNKPTRLNFFEISNWESHVVVVLKKKKKKSNASKKESIQPSPMFCYTSAWVVGPPCHASKRTRTLRTLISSEKVS